MLELNDIELKQTRFYQEIAEEERQEGRLEGLQEGRKEECIALLTRQLRRKFGLQPPLESILPRLSELSLKRLEDLPAHTIQDIRAYLEPVRFAGFRVEYGELVWGDYELCFPVIDLDRNMIEHDHSMTVPA